MLDDILQSAKQNLTERLSSPLLGAFAISWCGWNWKFLVILFSKASVTTTFSLVETVSFPDLSSILLYGLLFPLLVALAYVFIYPYPARYIYEFTLRRQREINEVKQRIAQETLLTFEESKKIRLKYTEKERNYTEEIQRLNEEIEHLREALNAQEKEGKPTHLSSADRLYGTLDSTQLLMLQTLDRMGGSATEQELIKQSPSTKTKAEFGIGELENRLLVNKNYSPNEGAYLIKFTHEGRRALLEGSRQESAT